MPLLGARTYGGAILRLAGLGLGAIVVLAVQIEPYFDEDSRILYGGLIAALSSVVVFAVGRAVEPLRDEYLRRERVRDMLTALHAEIAASDYSADMQAQTRAQNEALAIAAAQDGAIPFAVPDDSNFVFDTLSEEFSLLPQQVVEPVIVYYKLMKQTNAYVRTLSEPIFRELPPARRAKFVEDLLRLNRMQSAEGDRALDSIETYARDAGIRLTPSAEIKRRLSAEEKPLKTIRSAGGSGRT